MSFVYWIILAFCILPYVYGYIISFLECNPLRRFASIFFYATSVSWALLITPINLYEVGWVLVNTQQVIFTNVALMFVTELLIDPSPNFEPSCQTLYSTNSWAVLLVVIVYGCSIISQMIQGNSPKDTETQGDALSEKEFFLGTEVVDFFGSEFLADLTLFITVTEIFVSCVTAIIRRVLTSSYNSARYNNREFYAAISLLTIAAFAIKFVPVSPWGIIVHRLCTWSALYLCVSQRKSDAILYYAPIRSFSQQQSNISDSTTELIGSGTGFLPNGETFELCVVYPTK